MTHTREEHDHVICRKVELELGPSNSLHLQGPRRHYQVVSFTLRPPQSCGQESAMLSIIDTPWTKADPHLPTSCQLPWRSFPTYLYLTAMTIARTNPQKSHFLGIAPPAHLQNETVSSDGCQEVSNTTMANLRNLPLHSNCHYVCRRR